MVPDSPADAIDPGATFERERARVTLVAARRFKKLVAAIFGVLLIVGLLASPTVSVALSVFFAAMRLAARSVDAAHTRKVRVQGGALYLNDQLACAAADVMSARLDLDEKASVVVTPRKGAEISIELADPSDARALLAALGRESSATRFCGPSRLLNADFAQSWRSLLPDWWPLLAAACAILAGLAFVTPIAVGAILAVGVFFGASTPTHIDVGGDGVRVHWLWTSQFIPYREIVSAEAEDEALALGLTNGRRVVLRPRAERLDALAERVRANVERHRVAGADDAAAQLLRRGERPVVAFIDEVRRLGRDDGDAYRAVHVSRDQLWRIVEDPTLDGATRAGAAVALSSGLAEAERARIRVAAEATAAPRVRVALEAVADRHDDARLADALSGLEQEEEEPAIKAER